jgi:hypothetical protein
MIKPVGYPCAPQAAATTRAAVRMDDGKVDTTD